MCNLVYTWCVFSAILLRYSTYYFLSRFQSLYLAPCLSDFGYSMQNLIHTNKNNESPSPWDIQPTQIKCLELTQGTNIHVCLSAWVTNLKILHFLWQHFWISMCSKILCLYYRMSEKDMGAMSHKFHIKCTV